MAFFHISSSTVTLTEGQDHPRSYHFEGLPTGYTLANFITLLQNSIRDIVNVKACHRQTDGRTDRRRMVIT